MEMVLFICASNRNIIQTTNGIWNVWQQIIRDSLKDSGTRMNAIWQSLECKQPSVSVKCKRRLGLFCNWYLMIGLLHIQDTKHCASSQSWMYILNLRHGVGFKTGTCIVCYTKISTNMDILRVFLSYNYNWSCMVANVTRPSTHFFFFILSRSCSCFSLWL